MTLLSGPEMAVGGASIIFYVMCLPHYRGAELSTSKLLTGTGLSLPTMRRGLTVLVDAGYIHCTGKRGQNNELHYILSTTAPMLLPVPPESIEGQRAGVGAVGTGLAPVHAPPTLEKIFLHRPEEDEEEIPLFISDLNSSSSSEPADARKNFSTVAETEMVSPTLHNPVWGHSEFEDRELERRYKDILHLAGVYGKSFDRCVKALMWQAKCDAKLIAEGDPFQPIIPYWRHLLGHLAYARSGESGWHKVYACVIDACDHPGDCPDRFLPPVELSFKDALAWANRGGKTEAEITEAEQHEAELEWMERQRSTAPAPTPIPVPLPSPNALTEQVLAQLELEMSPGAYQTWVRRMSLHPNGDELTVHVPDDYTLDWLSNRLHHNLCRILRQFNHTFTVLTYLNPTTGKYQPLAFT